MKNDDVGEEAKTLSGRFQAEVLGAMGAAVKDWKGVKGRDRLVGIGEWQQKLLQSQALWVVNSGSVLATLGSWTVAGLDLKSRAPACCCRSSLAGAHHIV